jgi:tryptophan synthase alpha subunit
VDVGEEETLSVIVGVYGVRLSLVEAEEVDELEEVDEALAVPVDVKGVGVSVDETEEVEELEDVADGLVVNDGVVQCLSQASSSQA